MKQATALFLVLCLAAVSAFGQSRYVVFSTRGDVSLRKNGGAAWEPAAKRMPVALTDLCRIGSDAEVAILDREANLIYRSVTTGEQRVKNLLDRAKEQSRRTAATMAQVLWDGVTDTEKARGGFTATGATSRGSEETDSLTEQLYGALCRRLAEPDGVPAAGTLQAAWVPLPEGLCTLEVHNGSDAVCLVNVLRIDAADGSVTLCLDAAASDLLVPAQQTRNFAPYLFSGDRDGARYLLFGTPQPFDTDALRMLFRNRMPAAGEAELPGLQLVAVE